VDARTFFRTFLAPDGRRWRVWLVQPNARMGERRQPVDRRQTPVEEVLDPPLIERRRSAERRITPSAGLRVTPLPEVWRRGWLVFEPEDAEAAGPARRRRLAPVPECWRTCADEALTALWAGAEPSTRVA
jgi:hypothetical protein